MDKLDDTTNADLLLRVSGERSNNIQIKNTNYGHTKQKASVELGASQSQVKTYTINIKSRSMKKLIFYFLLLACSSAGAQQQLPYSQQLANTAIHMWPDSFSVIPGNQARWSYDQGVILKGMEGIWLASGDAKWFRYIQKQMDYYVAADGKSIYDYNREHYNIDHLNNGKLLLTLYRVTGREKYKNAVQLLREQLRTHPRTKEGGFWHKKIYPNQMWLDGLYMGQPFYAEYAQVFGEDTIFNDITRQFVLMEKHVRDKKTGLLYHGYDESREQQWANKTTGLSPHFWGRALGWFGMAMVDALDYFPQEHPGRKQIISILNRFAEAVVKVQDNKTGGWYDIVDLPNRAPNYIESSATAMLSFTLAKGVRMGYLPPKYRANAHNAFEGLVKNQLTISNGFTNLEGTVSVSGLGGKPYRDGSFKYYMTEKVVQNDPQGMGAFIKAAVEIEMFPDLNVGKGRRVVLDQFFNNEWKDGPAGQKINWHYTWDDRSNGGYHFLGSIFQQFGAEINTLKQAPTASNLKNASVYIIVDPDTEKETISPNYMTEAYASAIANWVKRGGILVMLTNDQGNAELEKFNVLSKKFGITFNSDNYLMVKKDNYVEGEVKIMPRNPVFKTAKNVFLKDVSSLALTPSVISILQKNGLDLMAVVKYGKGTVLALGDPWIYNEYIDGRKLPLEYENYKAGKDFVRYILQHAVTK